MSSALLSLLLAVLSADLSVQEEIVPQTVFAATATVGPDLSPKPTAFNLTKRADHIPPNICGWFEGSGYDGRWTYNDPSVTCFWNSDAKFVGNPDQPWTECVNEADWSTWSCSGVDCTSSVGRCVGLRPYCVTFAYGDDYRSYVCSAEGGAQYHMEPFWSGMSDPIAFPIYTGSKGISTGTQYPSGYSSSTTATDSDSNSRSSSSTSEASTGSSSNSDSSRHKSSSAPVGAIVGGVIGGLALIGLVVGIIIFFLMRRKKRGDSPQSQQTGPGFSPNSPPDGFQYQPVNSSLSPSFPSTGPSSQSRPQSFSPQQSPRYEVEAQYNKPELDGSGQYSGQNYPNQRAELPGM